MHKIPRLFAALVASAALLSVPVALAQDAKDAKSKAAPARADAAAKGKELYSQAYFDFMLKQRTAQGQPDTPELRTAVRDELNTRELLVREAKKQGIDKNPAIKTEMDLTSQTVLVRAYMTDYLKSHPVPEDQMKKEYDVIKGQIGDKEYKVRHILVDKEADAKDIIVALQKGEKFEKLAERSKDTGSKDKGGDLGWITQGQTVPEFEKVAFSLPKGSISDLVKTQYGFHIIKVLDKETAHTKTFDEVKDSIRAPLLLSKADKQAADIADKLSAAIRQSNKMSLDELAKQFHLTVGETRPVSATEPILELGNSKEVKDAIFGQRPDEVSLPIHTDRGYLIVAVRGVLPAHQGTLDEVRDRVVTELKQQKSTEIARQKADDLEKRLKSGERFETAAKALGLDPKTSDLFARNGSITGAASGKQLSAAFQMKPGDVGPPLNLGSSWFVYRILEKQEPNPADFEKQKKELTDQVLQTKRNLAFEAFRTALEARLKQEGKLRIMTEKLKGFGNLT